MAGSKHLLNEYGIHHRSKSCALNKRRIQEVLYDRNPFCHGSIFTPVKPTSLSEGYLHIQPHTKYDEESINLLSSMKAAGRHHQAIVTHNSCASPFAILAYSVQAASLSLVFYCENLGILITGFMHISSCIAFYLFCMLQ